MSEPREEPRSAVKQVCTVLYAGHPTLDAGALSAALRPLVGPVSVEWAEPGASGLPLTAGVVMFRSHRIAMLALGAPVSREVLARTVAVSPMPEELREELAGHSAGIRLLYMGDAAEPVDQLTALYFVAAVLVSQGGLGIINERAALAQPADLLYDLFPMLGGSPPPLAMWVGVLLFNNEEEGSRRHILARTFGMEQFGLPELGTYIGSREQADDAYHLLLNVGLYLVEGGPGLQIEAGHTVDFRGQTYLFTEPGGTGPEISGPTGLLVLSGV